MATLLLTTHYLEEANQLADRLAVIDHGTILFIAVYTGIGLNTDIGKGIYDHFRSKPTWPPAPVFVALLGDVLRYTIATVMVIVLGLILGFRS